VCLMANHLHLLIRPDDASQLPRLMHWISWYSAMALNRLSVRYSFRYIHANPMAAEIRKGFYDPYSNYGHYSLAVQADLRKRMSPPNRQDVPQISKELGIHRSTLWKRLQS